MSAKNLGEGLKFPGEAHNLFEARRIRGALHRLIDGVLQAGFGRQRRLAVFFLAGHHEVARQRPVRDQLAVDIAREIRFRHAVAIRRHALRDPLEPKKGDAHARGRDGERDGKTEDDLGAKPQGRKF
jgi:hypothetical protein